MSQDALAALVAALDRGEEAALVTIVSARGSTPQTVGAKVLVFPDGRTIGTIGGGCYENDAILKARACLQTRKSQLVSYELSDDFAEESGLICGGQMQVYIEPVEPAPRLYIIGAGHVGRCLARMAHAVCFRTFVLDDREKFANRECFPDAHEIIVESIPDWLHRAELLSSSYVVVVTRGHRHDLDALPSLAARDLRYLGLIGSKAKVKRIYDALLEDAMPIECLSNIYAPIGLDIGAVRKSLSAFSPSLWLCGAGRSRSLMSRPRPCGGGSSRQSSTKRDDSGNHSRCRASLAQGPKIS
jgi:xanthine dehydrogenase accessory factor